MIESDFNMYIYKEAKKIKAEESSSLISTVNEIIETVQNNGDKALNEYNVKFVGAHTNSFRVSPSDIEKAFNSISEESLETIKRAAKNIRRNR